MTGVSPIAIDAQRGVRFSERMTSLPHEQHAITLLVSLDHRVSVATHGRRVESRALLMPADLAHASACPGPAVAILSSPERDLRARAAARHLESPAPIAGARLDALLAVLRDLPPPSRGAAEWSAFAAACIEAAFPRGGAQPLDRRVDASLAAGDAAPPVGLSEAHWRALFAREIGIPPRRWRLWERLVRAVGDLDGADDLAAHALRHGFADHAHLTRTCRRLLGYAPSQLRGELTRSAASLPAAARAR